MRSSFRSLMGTSILCGVVLAGSLSGLTARQAAAEPAKKSSQIASPTHRQIGILRPKLDGDAIQLHTLKTDGEGHLLLAVSKLDVDAETAGPYGLAAPKDGYVLKIDSEGNELARWKCSFSPSAIAVSPAGKIFVGGGGKVAMLTDNGLTSEPIDSPHIGDRKTFAKRTIEAQQRMMRSFMTEESLQPLRDMVKQLEEVEEEERTRVQVAQLEALKSQLEQMESMIGDSDEEESDEEDDEEFELDPSMEASVQYAMAVTSMAASDDKVFVCASDPANGGYSIWSLTQDLDPESSDVIMSDLRGCCGQMDIQCCDGQLVLSENGSFRIGFYDQNGERTGQFGQMDRSSENGFGSCCNPMNSMPLPDGTVLTAESSIGHIKRFSADGTLIAYIGKAQIGGGCKHCAIGHDPENDLYYMMYQDKNAVCVLGNKEAYPISDAELAIVERQAAFTKTYAGTWTKEGTKVQKKSGGILASLFGGGDEEVPTSYEDSMLPVTSWTIDATGELSVDAGQYASFMTDAALELLPAEEGDADDVYRVAVTENQVRMLEGTVTIEGNAMTLDLGQGSPVKLLREGAPNAEGCEDGCEEGCDGSTCEKPECKEKHSAVEVEMTDMLADISSEAEVALVEVKEAEETVVEEYETQVMPEESDLGRHAIYDAEFLRPSFKYKLIAPNDFKADAEEKLNALGEKGWEYCGKLGGKLMFKQMDLKGLEMP
ncbi:MAG: hypothetical protein AAFV88_03225 [Planctomycetota bacterium]